MEYFLWPFMILALPLPWLIRFLSPQKNEKAEVSEDVLRVPFLDRISTFGHIQFSENKTPIRYFLIAAWSFLILAAMRPIWYEKELPTPQEVRNIMLAIDVSGSMAERDFNLKNQAVSRLDLVKDVVSDFISNRQSDRLGLIVFGSEAHTLSPLSNDLETLKEIFSQVGIGIAGEQTAIGDALALSVKDTAKIPSDKKIIILLSDGYNNAGVVSVDQAIELAQKNNIIVYTIGIGSDNQQLSQFFGMLPLQIPSSLDEKMLSLIAKQTGGKYFRAKSSRELKNIYQIIENLETTKIINPALRPRKELFYIPLIMALFCWILCDYLISRQSISLWSKP